MNQKPVGIVAEFDPLHRGHAWLLAQIRAAEPEAPIVVAMSGRFTQRGGAAVLSPLRRAEIALRCGADLVLELPLTWAISSAQTFAAGGIAVLRCAGVKRVYCGSECADLRPLRSAAKSLSSPEYPELLRTALAGGISFAAARQTAVQVLAGTRAAQVLSSPNDLLAVSYLEAMGADMELVPVRRTGAAHNAAAANDGYASASLVRSLLLSGETEQALALLPEEAQCVVEQAMADGEAPASLRHAERAMLARLRMMGPADFAALPDCSEGLEHRLHRAARQAVSMEAFCETARSRRYPLSRIRRLALWAFLGLDQSCHPAELPYLRLLGMNGRGRSVLRAMDPEGLRVLSTPGAGKKLSRQAQAYLALESRAADLWQLCLPNVGECGSLWRESAAIMSGE